MRNPRLVSFIAKTAEQIAADGTQWIEVMPTVEKDRNGPWYWTITRDDLEIYAADIRARAGQIPVDYDHAESGVGTKAAGWFTGEAEVRDVGDSASLWALVKWTGSAAAAIRDGEWKRISPEFTFENKDPKTGLLTKAKNLVAATLTNRPHFEQLAPVTAAVVWEPGEGLQDLLSRVFDALNPGGYDNAAYWVMDVTQSKALVGEYDGQRTWVVPFTIAESGEIDPAPRADWTPAEQEWVEAASASLKTTRAMRPFTGGVVMNEELLKALGLKQDATEAEAIAAAQALATRAESGDEGTGGDDPPPEGSVILTSEQVAELQANAAVGLKAGEELKELRVTAILETAVRAGKILPGQTESLKAWGLQDEEALAKHVEATPEHSFKLKAVGHGEGGGEGGDGDEAVKAAEDAVSRGSDAKEDRQVDGADIVVEAEKILAAAGKTSPTEAEYADALVKAERQIAAKAA